MDIDTDQLSPNASEQPHTLRKQKSAIRQSSELDNGLIRHKSSIRWDEDNLKENDIIKSYLSMQKIDEPKTPYRNSPTQSDDDELNFNQTPASDVAFLDKFDEINGSLRVRSFDEYQNIDDENVYTPKDVQDNKEEFEEKRKQHYNMMDNLRRGRELLDDSESNMVTEGNSNYENNLSKQTDNLQTNNNTFQGQDQFKVPLNIQQSPSMPSSSYSINSVSRSPSQIPINELNEFEAELKQRESIEGA